MLSAKYGFVSNESVERKDWYCGFCWYYVVCWWAWIKSFSLTNEITSTSKTKIRRIFKSCKFEHIPFWVSMRFSFVMHLSLFWMQNILSRFDLLNKLQNTIVTLYRTYNKLIQIKLMLLNRYCWVSQIQEVWGKRGCRAHHMVSTWKFIEDLITYKCNIYL